MAAFARVLLRDVEEADLEILFEYHCDPEATEMAAFPARERAAFIAHWQAIIGDPTLTAKAVLVDGAVAGDVVAWQDSGRTLVGYWIGREHWGRGVASGALAELLRILPTRPLQALVATRNHGSVRVLEKCGFVRSGNPSVGADGVEEALYVLAP